MTPSHALFFCFVFILVFIIVIIFVFIIVIIYPAWTQTSKKQQMYKKMLMKETISQSHALLFLSEISTLAMQLCVSTIKICRRPRTRRRSQSCRSARSPPSRPRKMSPFSRIITPFYYCTISFILHLKKNFFLFHTKCSVLCP